jgi:hypothetical protein
MTLQANGITIWSAAAGPVESPVRAAPAAKPRRSVLTVSRKSKYPRVSRARLFEKTVAVM